MELNAWFWFEAISLTVLLLILIGDLLLVLKRPHVPSMKEASLWVAFYVTLALIFAGLIWMLFGAERGLEFGTGWIIEYSLSVDNLFVFVIIMTRFAVPKKYQQYVLMVGIILALVFRGVFILLGVQLIESLSWVFYIFGAFLLYTAFKQAFDSAEEIEGEAEAGENVIVRALKKRLNFTNEFDGSKMSTRIDGKRFFTPMLIIFIAIGTTDVMFALDSIPAILGITQDPFIVFTANIFALMGLRQLYFLLGGLLDKLVYLHYGIAAILAFIGLKLIIHAMNANELPFLNGGEPITIIPDIEIVPSLLVILGCLTIATLASLIKMKIDAGKDASTVQEIAHGDREESTPDVE